MEGAKGVKKNKKNRVFINPRYTRFFFGLTQARGKRERFCERVF